MQTTVRKVPRIPVGATPVRRYRIWGEHRRAMRADAATARNRRLAALATVEGAQATPGDTAAALAVFTDAGPLTAREVATALGITHRNAFYALSELHAGGELGKKRIRNGAVVWWRPVAAA